MIIHFSFEELQALRAGARAVLDDPAGGVGGVAAPPRERVRVEALLRELDGDLSLRTLAEQGRAEGAVRTIAETTLERMNREIRWSHPASESAVASYFDYAHARAVLCRIEDAGTHMRALIELVTGEAPDDRVAETFAFPD